MRIGYPEASLKKWFGLAEQAGSPAAYEVLITKLISKSAILVNSCALQYLVILYAVFFSCRSLCRLSAVTRAIAHFKKLDR
jgi:hypothetical protein